MVPYTNYSPLADRPVNLWYYNPVDDPKDLPIMLVLHGASRNADDYRDNWIDLANRYNLFIVAPEFSKEHYPRSIFYNLGNMFDAENNDVPVPEEEWSYSIIEPIFDFVVSAIKGSQTSYDIFGHSAGSQFVHRFVLYKDEIRANRLIAANAGWYTMPDVSLEFPYGIKNSEADTDDIARIVQKEMIVLLGDADTLRTSNLRQTPEADIQGLHRFARGHAYFDAGKKAAEDLGVPFNWKKVIVPGVGHDNGGMAKYVAKELFE